MGTPRGVVEAAGLDLGTGKPQLTSSLAFPSVSIQCDKGDPTIIKDGTKVDNGSVVERRPVQGALAVAICCGSARLSEALQTAGMQVVGIDHSYNRHAPAVTTINIDIRDVAQHDLAWAWLEHPHLRFVGMAPPAGRALGLVKSLVVLGP